MKNLLITALLFIASASAMAVNSASYMRCSGTDTAGHSVYLITYPNSPIININGDMLKIVGPTRNGQGVVTQDFISVYGMLVYDAIIPVTNNSLTIYQFNAVTQVLLAQAWLTCNFFDNQVTTSNVIDYPLFDVIRANTLKFTKGMPYNK